MLNAFFDEDSYKLYIKKTNKYIENILKIVFISEFNPDNMVYLNILSNILCYGPKDISYKDYLYTLENNYNLNINITNKRLGKSIFTELKVSLLNSNYVKSHELDKIIELTFDTIYNPKITNETLKISNQTILNETLLKKDNSTINNVKTALNYIDKNIFNNQLKQNDITIKDIKNFYKNFLEQSKKYIYFIGDYSSKKIYSLIKKYNHFNSIQTKKFDYYLNDLSSKRCKNISKNKHFTYLDIVQIYTYKPLTKFEQNYVLPIFNLIIGGDLINGVIFKKLREKEGLVYSLNTFYKKHDRLLILETSSKKENYNMVIRIIRNSFKQIKKGLFSNESLDNAKNLIISNLDSSPDIEEKLIDKCILKTILKDDDIETKINNYKKVNKNDIIKLSYKIKLIINYKSGEDNE